MNAAAGHPDSARFAFGDNWRKFLDRLDETRIVQAETSLRRLLDRERLDGASFLDIGSGSGLFSLAARRLGARVHSFDFDPASVACSNSLRDRYFANDPQWSVEHGSVLDRDYLGKLGAFDIVYSWGVLHHTGDMTQAVANAAALVSPGGLFVVALYRRTRLCRAWTREKRWYVGASPWAQSLARAVYTNLMRVKFALSGKDFAAYVTNYQSNRGMDFERDVHDWMGGYPYESIAPDDTGRLMAGLGFAQVRSFTQPFSTGFFGSGCDEYVYRAAPR